MQLVLLHWLVSWAKRGESGHFSLTFHAQGDRGNPDTKNVAKLTAFFVSGGGGDEGMRRNSRHEKHGHFGVFFVLGITTKSTRCTCGKAPNTKTHPKRMCLCARHEPYALTTSKREGRVKTKERIDVFDRVRAVQPLSHRNERGGIHFNRIRAAKPLFHWNRRGGSPSEVLCWNGGGGSQPLRPVVKPAFS